ncbi:hypothetical protein FBUS_05042 [Fasciolopsis buskii]|uniref:Uncharacterized protein n=1 Tax=Fasciolopsis buskii TaxID=27845 RepID=A0A8E0RVH9_9TREM|nr:hypothetical protein FBUS_05042 [Fasciolopsis buski]
MNPGPVILVLCLIAVQADQDPQENPVLNDELRGLLDPDSLETFATRRPTTDTPSAANEDDSEVDPDAESEFPCRDSEEEDDNNEPSSPQREEEPEQDFESDNDFDWVRESNRLSPHNRPHWGPWRTRRPPYLGWWGIHGF